MQIRAFKQQKWEISLLKILEEVVFLDLKQFLVLFLKLKFVKVNIRFNYFALRYAVFYNTLSKLSVQLLKVCGRKLQLIWHIS